MSDDYGYFGKGIDGYVHYMQSVDESKRSGGSRPPSKSGCLTSVLFVCSGIAFIVFSSILLI